MEEGLPASATRHLIRYAGGDFFPFLIARAEGSLVYDTHGRAILDFTSGQMCATLGHRHPAVVAAIEKSLKEAIHLFSWTLSPPVVGLAEDLAALLPPSLDKALFLSTGSESNEAALRLARLASGGFEVIAFSAGYHGLTAGSGSHTYALPRRGFGPGMPGSLTLPAPYAFRCPIRHCRERCDMTCLEVGFEQVDRQSVGAPAAVIVEPVLSAAGIVVPPPGYLARLAALARERGFLVIFDEAQTALGRLGSLFAFEHEGVVPDILTLSKTLGGGLPLAATVTGAAIEERAVAAGFSHLTSHTSDPLPAEVGRAVIATVVGERLAERARVLGARLEAGLRDLMQRYEVIGDVRGRGLLWGVELVRDRASREPAAVLGARITRACLERGLSMNIAARRQSGAVWRIAPPLTASEDEIDRALAIIDGAIAESLAEGGG